MHKLILTSVPYRYLQADTTVHKLECAQMVVDGRYLFSEVTTTSRDMQNLVFAVTLARYFYLHCGCHSGTLALAKTCKNIYVLSHVKMGLLFASSTV